MRERRLYYGAASEVGTAGVLDLGTESRDVL
jgi:hypothetical protein